MNILMVIILLYLSLYIVYPIIFKNLNFFDYKIEDLLYFSLYVMINLMIFNIIGNIFRKNKDSLFTIITKNLLNTFFISTFLFIIINFLSSYFNIDNINNNYHIGTIIIVSPLIIKSFLLSLLQKY